MNGPAAYTLRFEARDDYLFARVEGPESSPAVAIAYWTEIRSTCRADGIERLLVVGALGGKGVPEEMPDVMEALIGLGLQDIRVAYVDANENAGVLVAAEGLAHAAGLTGRVFRGEAEAERWLLADPRLAPAGAPAVAARLPLA